VPDAELADAALPDLRGHRRVHVIGAGGSGMSAIALVLLGMGHRVTGSDGADSATLRRLGEMGVVVHAGHDPAWIGDAEVVVTSTAIPAGNVEVLAARDRGLRVWRRAEVLAAICSGRRVVAVAGTHGKTTTSSILAAVLQGGGRHPSFVIGGDIAGVGPGGRWDDAGDWMVVEADESDGTFLAVGAEAAVVTSVEPDHLDFYGSEAAMRKAFETFATQAPGPVILCADEEGAASLAREAGGTTYGTSAAADVRIVGVSLESAAARFCLQTADAIHGPFHLAAPGLHNVRNAAAALATAHALGVGWDTAGAALTGYQGVARRFERRGQRDGVTFVDDYGHLPGEVAAVLATACAGDWARVVAVFQPHRYSRTEALWADFADAFEGADVLVVTDIYPAGESARPGVTGRLIVDGVRAAHPDLDVQYAPSLDDAEGVLRRILRPGDLCLTLGAGDLTRLPDRFVDPTLGANP
jgi:UDP-N-acetylmuramate--alanine ligase